MAVTKYLDKTGLTYFWSKIKAWCNSVFALDSNVVHKTGNETIAGTKTFSSSPVVPTPATSDDSTKTATTAFVKAQGYVTANDKVKQISGTGNSNRPILVRYNAANASETDGYAVYNDNVTINTSTGVLTNFTGHTINRIDITKGTNPSATKYWTLTFCDKDGANYTNNCIGMLETSLSSAGVVKTYMRAMKNTAATATPCEIAVIYDTANSTGYTQAPTPATSDNSTKIATTAFVKAQGYLTSHQSLANYVTLDGIQTISGVKSFSTTTYFSNFIVAKHPDVNKGTNPSTIKVWTLRLCDKNGDGDNNALGKLETELHDNGVISTSLHVYKNIANNSDSNSMGICYSTANSEVYTYAPTPNTSDNSTKIATTAFVKAQGYITSSGTAANVTGTVSILNGGTGATSRLGAIKALVNESVSTNATHFLGLKSDWSKVGYISVADAKTVLGLGTAAYSSSDTFATAVHTHSYLPLSGGNLTGSIKLNSTSTIGIYKGNATSVSEFSGGSTLSKGARLALYGESHSSTAGKVDLIAANASTAKHLILLPDGTFTWDGTAVSLNGHTHSYLPLAGGTVTGDILFGTIGRLSSSGNITKQNNTTVTYICGGTSNATANGAFIALYGSSHSSKANKFEIYTGKVNNNYAALVGDGGGTLSWNGQTVQTSSDKRLKTNLSTVSDEILDIWETISWGNYKYLSAIDQKGNSARLHLGLIAQDIDDIFKKHNLNICDYGILCYDDENDMWMIRYTEALAMEAAYQRRKNKILEERISDLENQLESVLEILQSIKGVS